MSETIEERYAELRDNLHGYVDGFAVMKLLDDLMAEREKMKKKIYALEKFIDIISKEPVTESK